MESRGGRICQGSVAAESVDAFTIRATSPVRGGGSAGGLLARGAETGRGAGEGAGATGSIGGSGARDGSALGFVVNGATARAAASRNASVENIAVCSGSFGETGAGGA
jgi:hypothetical protein